MPLLFGAGILYYYKNSVRRAEDIGLGEGTSTYLPAVNGYPVHITEPKFTDSLIKGWQARGSKPLFLWIGNSQLHGVNQYMEGNKNATEFLFHNLSTANAEAAGASYPNANLQEFLVSVLYFSQKLPLKGIILPVFYDDMREDGIRDVIAINPVTELIKKDSAYFEGLNAIENLELKDTAAVSEGKDDYSGIKETAQDIAERYLNERMENSWGIWKSRPDFRGSLFNDLYIFRNMALGIKPGTQRKMIPGRFNDNYHAFKYILQYCADKKIPLLVYIPPIRNDVPLPYDMEAYTGFKKNVEKDAQQHGASFINLETLVPNKYWGMKSSTSSFTGKGEVDFMHFQEMGHRLVADTIFKTLVSRP